jgi:tight adherence protein C
MSSVLLLAFVTFLAVTAFCVVMLIALFPPSGSVGQRLSAIWGSSSSVNQARFRERQQKRFEKALTGLGRLLPSSEKELTHSLQLMVRAGYRSPETVLIMRGVKVLLPIALLVLVLFTGWYKQNPIFILLAAAAAGFLLPEFWLTWCVRVRQKWIVLGLADALDLLVVCVEAGLGLDQALSRVAQEILIAHPALSEELQLVNLEMRVGKSRVEALRELAVRTGVEDLKALTAMLIQTDRFGTDLAQALRVYSDNLRTKRRQRAEELASKTTIKMVPPLVFFIFPALFVVLLGPAVIILMRQIVPAIK